MMVANFSWGRRVAPIIGTFGIHAALLILAFRQPDFPSPKHLIAPIEMRIEGRPLEPPPQSPTPRPPRPSPELRAQPAIVPPPIAARPFPAPAAQPAKPAPVQPAPAEPPAPSPAPGASGGRPIDLFPSATLNRLAGGGAAGAAKPKVADGLDASAREAKSRIDGWLAEDMARQRVQSGDVDPVWRQIESSVLDRFEPPEELVRAGKDKMTLKERFINQTTSVAKQMWMAPQNVDPAPPSRFAAPEPRIGGGPEDHIWRNAQNVDQALATQQAWNKPTDWRRIEVELRTDSMGDVESVRIVVSSGVEKLDELAKKAIEQAARARPAQRDDGKHTVTRWAVECSYAANALNRVGFTFDEAGTLKRGHGARGINRFITDPQYLVGGKVHRKVSLLSMRYE